MPDPVVPNAPASPAPAAAATPVVATPQSPSPQTPSSVPPETPPAPQESDFGGLGDPLDEDFLVLEAEEPAAPVAEPVQPAAAEPAQPVPAQPPQPAAAAPQPTPQEPTEPPSSTPTEPQGLAQQLEQHREAVIDALAAQRFSLSKEEAEALELDAVKAIPKLMAKTYHQAVSSALLHIQNFVPQMVASTVAAMELQRQREESFYGRHKALDKSKHAGDVNTFFSAFRQQNPQAAVDDLLSMVAAAVMAKHGLQPVALAAQPNGHAPASPPQPAAPPFVPARPGTSVRVTPDAENPFAGLGRDFDD